MTTAVYSGLTLGHHLSCKRIGSLRTLRDIPVSTGHDVDDHGQLSQRPLRPDTDRAGPGWGSLREHRDTLGSGESKGDAGEACGDDSVVRFGRS